jgi:HK97 family phage portal protein
MSKVRSGGGRLLDAIGAGLTAAGAALRSTSSGVATPDPWMYELFAPKTNSGVTVNETSAMRLAAHFACVSLTARVVASFPVQLFERLPDGRKRKATDHPVYHLLHDQPNPEMTSFSFKEVLQANLSNTGRAFSEIVWTKSGYPKELWPIPPALVTPRRRTDGKLEYLVNGEQVPGWKILHIPGIGFDGLNSFSPVGLFREQIGLGLAAEQFGARFFGQGTNIGGFIEYPDKMSDDAYRRLKTSMDEKYRGLQNSHGTIILEQGAKYAKLGMSMADAAFIETQKLNRSTIAMIHGVPPHLIGDLERSTNNNIEHQGIEAVVYLFRPWAMRWEQALTARLLTPKEQERFYFRFNLDGLLRGDTKARFEAYAIARQWGWSNVNEIRELEDKDPIGEEGDVYLQPLNMVPAGKEARAALVEIVKTVLSETNARAKQVDVIEPDDPKTVPDRQHEPSDFNEIRKTFCAAALPGLQADPTTTVRAVYAALQASVVAEGFQVRGDGEPFLRDYLAGLERRMNGLDMATEMHRLRCAALRDLYRRAGVSRFEIVTGQAWVRAGGSPQFRLVAGADEPFLEKNEEVTDGALNLRAPYRVWHPPVFPGDDSEIVPVREV